MKISVLKTIGLAAVAALVCVGCTDDGANTGGREADVFLDRTNGTTYTLATRITTIPGTGGDGGGVSRDPSRERYIPGEEVTVTAAPASNYVFMGWSGASNAEGKSVTIEMDSSKTITANFTRTYTLIVNTSTFNGGDGGYVSRNPAGSPNLSDGVYLHNAQVAVTVTPSSGYEFTGWSGASLSASSAINITMDENKTLTAGFKRKFTLGTYTDPSDAGYVARNPARDYYLDGDEVTITAISNSSDYVFFKWKDDSTAANPRRVTMDGNREFTAGFMPAYTLLTDVNPSGSGKVSRSPVSSLNLKDGFYKAGDSVELTATGEPGWTFEHWSPKGATQTILSTANPWTVTMDGSRELTAVFKQDRYPLNITIDPSGGGDVTRNPDRDYTYGEQVTVTAAPNLPCYRFSHWSGALSSTNSTIIITMYGPMSLTAHFVPLQYTLTTSGTGGTVSPSGQTSRNCGTQVIVTATPNPCYRFSSWSDGSTANPRTVQMDGHKEVIAYFEPGQQYTLFTDVFPVGIGEVSRVPDLEYYTCGIQAVLTATTLDDDYEFINWSDGSTEYQRTVTISRDTTLVANFAERQYTVIFDANGGSGSCDPTTNLYRDSNVSLPDPEQCGLFREGYEFFGWDLDSSAVSPDYYPDYYYVVNSDDAVNGIITMYAIWWADE